MFFFNYNSYIKKVILTIAIFFYLPVCSMEDDDRCMALESPQSIIERHYHELPGARLSAIGFGLLKKAEQKGNDWQRKQEQGLRLLKEAARKGDPNALYATGRISEAAILRHPQAGYQYACDLLEKALRISFEQPDPQIIFTAYYLLKKIVELPPCVFIIPNEVTLTCDRALRSQAAVLLGRLGICGYLPECEGDDRAPFYFSMAEELGNHDAVGELSRLYLRRKEKEKAKDYGQRSRLLEEARHAIACLKSGNDARGEAALGSVLQKAPHVLRESSGTTVKLYRDVVDDAVKTLVGRIRASRGNVPQQCLWLSSFYAYHEPEKNKEAAVYWLQQALYAGAEPWKEPTFIKSMRQAGVDEALHSLHDHRSHFICGIIALQDNDYKPARHHFRLAAQLGNFYARCQLAYTFLKGSSGFASASIELNELLTHSEGWQFLPYFVQLCDDDPDVSKILERDISDDDMHARFINGLISYIKNEDERTIYYLKPIADQKDDIAQFCMAHVLYSKGLDESMKAAASYYADALSHTRNRFIRDLSLQALSELARRGIIDAAGPYLMAACSNAQLRQEALDILFLIIREWDKQGQIVCASQLLSPAISQILNEYERKKDLYVTYLLGFANYVCGTSQPGDKPQISADERADFLKEALCRWERTCHEDECKEQQRRIIREAIINDIRLQLGVLCSDEGKAEDAFQYYKDVAESGPNALHNALMGIWNLISSDESTISPQQAREYFQYLENHVEEDKELLFLIGVSYLGKAFPCRLKVKLDCQKAYKYLDKCIQVSSQDDLYYADACYELGLLLQKHEGEDGIPHDLQRAYRLCKYALERGPGQYETEQNCAMVGTLAYKNGDFPVALRFLEKAQSCPESLLCLGILHLCGRGMQEPDRAKALDYFERALDPCYFEDLSNKACDYCDADTMSILQSLLNHEQYGQRVRPIFVSLAAWLDMPLAVMTMPWVQPFIGVARDILQCEADSGATWAHCLLVRLHHYGRLYQKSHCELLLWLRRALSNQDQEVLLTVKSNLRPVLDSLIQSKEMYSWQYESLEHISACYDIARILAQDKDPVFYTAACQLFLTAEKSVVHRRQKDDGQHDVLRRMAATSGAYDQLDQLARRDCLAARTLAGAHLVRIQAGCYLTGYVEDDVIKIVGLLDGIKQRDPEACGMLHSAYVHLAEHFSKNNKWIEVQRCFVKALEYKEDDATKFNLTLLYLDQTLPDVKPQQAVNKALRMLKELADNGHVQAQETLGLLYNPKTRSETGCGGKIKKDRTLSEQYSRMATNQQSEVGMQCLASTTSDPQHARLLCQRCGEDGDDFRSVISKKLDKIIPLYTQLMDLLLKRRKNQGLKQQLDEGFEEIKCMYIQLDKKGSLHDDFSFAELCTQMICLDLLYGDIQSAAVKFQEAIRRLIFAVEKGAIKDGQFVVKKADFEETVKNLTEERNGFPEDQRHRLGILLNTLKAKVRQQGVEIH